MMNKPRISSVMLAVMLLIPALTSYALAWMTGAAYMAFWGHALLCTILTIAAWEVIASKLEGDTLSKLFGRFYDEHPAMAIVWLVVFNAAIGVGLTIHLLAMR